MSSVGLFFIFQNLCPPDKQCRSVALTIKICGALAADDSCCRISSVLVFNRFKSYFAAVVTDMQ